MKRIFSVACAAVCAIVICTPRAAEAALPAMRFEGLERTRTDHLRSLVATCLEDQGAPALDRVDPPELEQCLTNSELFSEVRVTIDEDLLVAAQERWTLIPLVFFRSQEDSTSYGVFLFESNFLGRGQLLGIGATFGGLANSYLLFLRDPSVAGSDWTAMLATRRESGDVFRYEGDAKVDGHSLGESSFTIAPGYQFTPDLEGRLLVGFTDRNYSGNPPFKAVPEDHRSWSAGLALELDRTDFKFFFREGHKVRVRVARQFERTGGGDPTSQYELEWDWQRSFFGRTVAKLHLESMGVDSGAVSDSFQLGGRDMLRGVQDKGLWARNLTGAVLDFHVPFWSGRFGTWAAGPFVSYATYQPADGSDASGRQDTLTYGAGLFFYLRKVAFPGIGIVAGRNEAFSGDFVSVQIGVSF